jgi:hypothetical protein
VATTPATVKQLIGLGYDVVIESGAGELSSFADPAYTEAGARTGTAEDAWGADAVLRVNAPSLEDVGRPKDGAYLVSTLAPALNPELVDAGGGRGEHEGRLGDRRHGRGHGRQRRGQRLRPEGRHRKRRGHPRLHRPSCSTTT